MGGTITRIRHSTHPRCHQLRGSVELNSILVTHPSKGLYHISSYSSHKEKLAGPYENVKACQETEDDDLWCT